MRTCTSLILILISTFATPLWGSVENLSYQGRILKADGQPLEYNSVSFIFEITNPSGNCIIYREQKNGVNLAGTGGVFDVPIGTGTKLFPPSPTVGLMDIFNNAANLDCGDGSNNISGTYTPSASHGRLLYVKFHDGVGWNSITPETEIRSVPYAAHAKTALSANSLSGKTASEFIEKITIPTCPADTFLTFSSGAFTCAGVTGAAGGTVTNVASGNSYLTIINGTTSPTLTVNVGTAANTVAAGNDSRFGNALRVQGVTIDATAPTTGQVLKFDGTNWAPAADSSNTGTVTSVSGTAGQISVTSGATTPVLSLANVGTSGTYYKVTTDAQGRVTSGSSLLIATDIPSLDFSKITSGLPTTVGGYGITDAIKNLGGTPGFKSGTNATKGAAGTAGNIYIATDTKEIYRDNGTTWDLVGSASGTGGTITEVTAGTGLTGGGTSGAVSLAVNVGNGANQIVQLDASSKLPAVDGSALTNLNPANLSAVVPVTKGGTGQATATAGFNALSPLATKGDLLTRDGSNNIRLGVGSNGQILSADSGETSGLKWITPNTGTVTSVSATSPLSVATGTSTPAISISNGSATGQALRWGGASWIATKLTYTDLINSTAASPWPSVTCSTGQAVIWSSASDSFVCSTITISGSNFASQSAGVVFAGPTAGSAAPAFRTLASTDLPLTGANGVFVNGGNSFGTGATVGTNDNFNFSLKANGSSALTVTPAGNVGVGVTPSYLFHVAKNQNSITESRIENLIATGNTAAGARLQIVSNDSSGQIVAYPSDFATAAYADRFIIAANSTASNGLTLTTNTTAPIDLMANGAATPALRVTSTNQVAVGTTAVTGRLSNTSVNYGDLGNGMTFNSFNWLQPDVTGWAGSFASAGDQGLVVATDNTTGTVFQASSGAYTVGTARRANPLFTVKGTGNVGIGTTAPTALLSVKGNTLFGDKTTFPTDFNTIESNTFGNFIYNNTATTGTFGTMGSWMRVTPSANSTLASQAISAGLSYNVPSGVTVTSNSDALWVSAARNRYTANTDSGTVTSMRGITVGYGHENYVPANTPVTTNAYGIVVNPAVATGTITNMYDLYLSSGSTGGTVTNKYAVYQADGTAKNFFNGYIAVGGAGKPASAIDIIADNDLDTADDFNIHSYSATTTPGIILTRGRGTEAAPSAVLNGDLLGGIHFRGWTSATTIGSAGSVQAAAEGNWTTSSTPASLRFIYNNGTSTAEGMRIASNGYIGMGTNAPSGHLTVSNSTALYTMIYNTHTGTGGQAWRWLSSSTAAPLGANAMCFGLGTCLFSLYSSGNATLAGTLTQSSDIRLKKDITPLTGALDAISTIAGVNYYWKDSEKDSGRQLGLIAQNVEAVYPEAVKTDKSGYKSVAYQNLIAPIIEALKELKEKWINDSKNIHTQLAKQNREIASLKEENLRLKAEDQNREERLRLLEQRLNALDSLQGK